MGRTANMFLEPPAITINTRYQKRLQPRGSVRKPSLRKRVSTGAHAFHTLLSHDLARGHCINVTWSCISTERPHTTSLL